MIRAFINRLLGRREVSATKTPKPDGRIPQEFRPKLITPLRVNKYEPQAGHGPWPAARRVRAMVRSASPRRDCAIYDTMHGPRTRASFLAVTEEYERHVRNGNVY